MHIAPNRVQHGCMISVCAKLRLLTLSVKITRWLFSLKFVIHSVPQYPSDICNQRQHDFGTPTGFKRGKKLGVNRFAHVCQLLIISTPFFGQIWPLDHEWPMTRKKKTPEAEDSLNGVSATPQARSNIIHKIQHLFRVYLTVGIKKEQPAEVTNVGGKTFHFYEKWVCPPVGFYHGLWFWSLHHRWRLPGDCRWKYI